MLDLEIWNVRKCVYDGSRALMPGAARHELARWLTGVREVSRVLFPEEGADRQIRARAGEGWSATEGPSGR